MAINKKLISFATQAQFDTQVSAGNIDNRSIIFIEDKKRIWTHGVFFDTSWDFVTGKPSTLSGYEITDAYTKAEVNSLASYVGAYSFSNGFLVKTNVARTENSMLVLHIKGNSYGGLVPVNTFVQVYNYTTSDAIIQTGALNNGYRINEVKAFYYDNLVYFWIPQQTSFMTMTFQLLKAEGQVNRVDSVTNAAVPATGVEKMVTIIPRTAWFENTLTNLSQLTDNIGVGSHIQDNTKHITSTERTNWNTAYGWGNHSGLYTLRGEYRNFGAITLSSATGSTADFIARLTTIGFFNYSHSVGKASWSYAGNQDITDTGFGTIETAGAVIETYQDGSNKTIKITCANTGGSTPYRVFVYNDQGPTYSPGWREVLTNKTPTVTDWNTAYNYSQVGHLPLSGGTLTGALAINLGASASSPLSLTSAGVTTSIGSLNATWCHFDTTATTGFYFYKNIQTPLDITARNFIGALSGNASSATYASAVTLTADNATNATRYPLFASAATGNLSPSTDTGFTYNPSTGILTSTRFAGYASASDLDTGTVPDARLTGVYTGFTHRIDGANTIFTTPSIGSTAATGRTVYGLAEYRSAAPAQIGAIVFIAPFGITSTMMQFTIKGMEYTRNVIDFTAQCYNYSAATWTNLFKVNRGEVDVPVRFGYNVDGKFCIIVGDTTTSWSYPHLTIVEAMLSHSISDTYCYGWSTGVVTDLSTFTNVTLLSNSPLVTDITGNASTATKLSSSRTFALTGDVTGTITSDLTSGVSIATTIAANSIALGTNTTGNYAASVGVSGNGLTITGAAGEGTAFTVNSNATNANTGSTLVFRDASGNFSAGTITAALSGNATTATTATYLTRAGSSITTAPATYGLRFDTSIGSATEGIFPTSNNSNAVITLNRHSGAYDSQLGFSSDGNIYYRAFTDVALDTTQAWRTIWDSSNFTNLNQLTTRNFSDLQSKPTTLSGYGITDAVASSKLEVVTELPTSPVTGTFYFIKE